MPTALDEYVIDHIVPRAKGGLDAAENYTVTTRRANNDILKEIAEVVPETIWFEKPALAETIYGARDDYGSEYCAACGFSVAGDEPTTPVGHI